MTNPIYDLQVAEAQWHELQAEAEQERLVKAALKLRREQAGGEPRLRSRLARFLAALRRRTNDGAPADARKN